MKKWKRNNDMCPVCGQKIAFKRKEIGGKEETVVVCTNCMREWKVA